MDSEIKKTLKDIKLKIEEIKILIFGILVVKFVL